MFLVKDLSGNKFEYESLGDAKTRFNEYPNTIEIVDLIENKTILSRTHNEVGQIEINNKCVYLKVPFYQTSDNPKNVISKIGETPEKLRSKMDVIDEKWNINLHEL